MKEKEIRKQLFDLHLQYMKYTPEQKEQFQGEYVQKLKEVRRKLALLKTQEKENQAKVK